MSVDRRVDEDDASIGELTLDRILEEFRAQLVVGDEGLGDEVVRGTTIDECGGSTAGQGNLDVEQGSTRSCTEVGGGLSLFHLGDRS
jgi:hypothetical protein